MRKKRLKTVFRNDSKCVDAFISQSQPIGTFKTKSRQGGPLTPVYFSGKRIFSYGSHYLLGCVGLELSGKPIAVVNFTHYSRQTDSHSDMLFNKLESAGYTVLKIDHGPNGSSIDTYTTDLELEALAEINLKRESLQLIAEQSVEFIDPDYYLKYLKKDIQKFNETVLLFGMKNLTVKINEIGLKRGIRAYRKRQEARNDYSSRRSDFLFPIKYRAEKALRRLAV